MLALLFVAEFWIETREEAPIDPKFVMNNTLTPTFGLFVRDYNLWRFSNGKLCAKHL